MCKKWIRNVFQIFLSAVISCNDFSPQFRTEKITLKFIQVNWLTLFFVQIERVRYFEPPLFQLFWFCIVERNLRNFDKLLSDSYHLIELEAPIPPSFLVPHSLRSWTFFHSAIPRGIDFITPQILKVLTKIPRGPRKYSLQISKENLKGVINKKKLAKKCDLLSETVQNLLVSHEI